MDHAGIPDLSSAAASPSEISGINSQDWVPWPGMLRGADPQPYRGARLCSGPLLKNIDTLDDTGAGGAGDTVTAVNVQEGEQTQCRELAAKSTTS